MRINAKNIYFTLVEPETPGNIGAAARALKTMGFSNLCLVNPGNYRAEEAKWMAHASEDILENAILYKHIHEAVADKNFVIAATQRNRNFHLPYYSAAQLAEKIIPISKENKVCILFGRESSGLSNEELSACDAITTIPANSTHPSLNLAQAVMIYAYEFYKTAYGDLKEYHWKIAKHSDLVSLYKHMWESLERVGFVPIDSWENFTMRFSRLMGRANMEIRDVRVWHKIFKSFDNYISKIEKKLEKK
jgi:TrmH family RNA methyltransferase